MRIPIGDLSYGMVVTDPGGPANLEPMCRISAVQVFLDQAVEQAQGHDQWSRRQGIGVTAVADSSERETQRRARETGRKGERDTERNMDKRAREGKKERKREREKARKTDREKEGKRERENEGKRERGKEGKRERENERKGEREKERKKET